MHSLSKLSTFTALALCTSTVLARPPKLVLSEPQDNTANITARNSDRDIPPVPDRPSDLSDWAFHGSRFDFFDEISSRIGFLDNGGHPAVVHAPVFLYARPNGNSDPCYPEGGTNAAGDGPNPGSGYVSGTADINPGHDCMDPGDYHGGECFLCLWTTNM